jgi:hypothetical protein
MRVVYSCIPNARTSAASDSGLYLKTNLGGGTEYYHNDRAVNNRVLVFFPNMGYVASSTAAAPEQDLNELEVITYQNQQFIYQNMDPTDWQTVNLVSEFKLWISDHNDDDPISNTYVSKNWVVLLEFLKISK